MGPGRLPRDHADALADAIRSHDVYVVRSYNTPILWIVGGVTVIPDVKYSATTSRHLSTLRGVLG